MPHRKLGVATIVTTLALIGAPGPANHPKAIRAAPPLSPSRINARQLPAVDHMQEGMRGLLAELQMWRRRAETGEAGGPHGGGSAPLELLRLEAETGNYAAAHRQADRLLGARTPTVVDDPRDVLEGFTAQDGLAAVAAVADSARVIMVNEAHHVPQHRAFTLDLLSVLRRKGFTHFAAETLDEADTQLANRGYPTPLTGAYIGEPVYGDLVRTALRLGYRVVAYEARDFKSPARREQQQAQNLIDRTLRQDPRAKILVHAGYRHINEAGTLAGAPPMAIRFKEATGIDPFTVDQTEMTEHSAPEYEHPVYRDAVAQRHVVRPTVFRASSGRLWTLDRGVRDVTLFHPRTRYEYGRPTWLQLGGRRAPYYLPEHVCGRETRCLVEARAAGEGSDAVPLDRVEFTALGVPPALMLPPGLHQITVLAQDGRTMAALPARVPERRPVPH